MPELPEVELVARELRPSVLRRHVLRVLESREDVFLTGASTRLNDVEGCRFESLRRRGKLLIFELSDDLVLTVHLRMTGRLETTEPDHPRQPHTHLILELSDGRQLRFADTRRFGRMQLLRRDDLSNDPFLLRLGPEPSELDVESLSQRLRPRIGSLKGALLDQSLVAGLGNIYVDEILHRAGLHPLLSAGRLRPHERALLASTMSSVIEEAIAAGGSTISDYRQVNGSAGRYQLEHRVFGREGKKCHGCEGEIRKLVVTGRGTHLCPNCQPRRRGRMSGERRRQR